MAVIELQEPFKSLWRKGYLRYSDIDGRGRVDLYNSDSDRTTISYARYLKSVELGYMIPDGYEVDHDDKDKTNDSLSNLKVLSKEKHLDKTRMENSTGRAKIVLKCSSCGRHFEREKRLMDAYSRKFLCSMECRKSFTKFNLPISEQEIEKIKEFSNTLSAPKIAVIIKRSPKVVRKYLKKIEGNG